MAWMALVSSMIWLEKQLLVLLLLLLDCLPLAVGQHLALPVRKVHADHHEGRQEYGFERHDHGEQSERVGLDQEADPGGKPDDVDIDASAVKPEDRIPTRTCQATVASMAPAGRLQRRIRA